MIAKLETYCSSPYFTEPMQKFCQENCVKFTVKEGEYPLEYQSVYVNYTKLIDTLLESTYIIRFC